MEMAQDVLCLTLYNHEIHGSKISPPTPLTIVEAPENGIVTLIACDTNYYKRYFANELVSKTVTIPARLDLEAELAGVNFSQVLRTGLEQILQQKA